jgi:hypothetical protein
MGSACRTAKSALGYTKSNSTRKISPEPNREDKEAGIDIHALIDKHLYFTDFSSDWSNTPSPLCASQRQQTKMSIDTQVCSIPMR